MKRTIDEQLGECEDELFISRPLKRITMCHNTPKEARDEKKKLMKTSKKKLKQLSNPESNLRRSLLVNNVYKRLQTELRQEKENKYYGYAFNPKCPFGFGAGTREMSQRKRRAKLELALTDKWRAHEVKRHGEVIDPNTSFMEIFDGDGSYAADEQLLRLVESMDVKLCCSDNKENGSKVTNNGDNASSQLSQHCDNNMDVSNIQDSLCCDADQQMLKESCLECTNERLMVNSDSTFHIQTSQVALLPTFRDCDDVEMSSAPSQGSHTGYQRGLSEVVECYSENEDDEIDVCSCEDDPQQKDFPLVTTASEMLMLQQQQAAQSSGCSNSNVMTSSVPANYSLANQSINCVNNTGNSDMIISCSSEQTNHRSDFPPKSEKQLVEDISNQVSYNNDTSLIRQPEDGDNNDNSDRQRGFSVFHFTGKEGEENFLNGFSSSTSLAQGQLPTSLYSSRVLGHVLSPFCHPLFAVANPFYNTLLSAGGCDTTSSAVTSLTGYYSPSTLTGRLYPPGLMATGYMSNSNNTNSMVTCT